jgi:hypothetical protein
MLIEIKDIVLLLFFGIALYIEHRRGVQLGIEAGVEGTLRNLVEDGTIDVCEKTGEITKKL